MSVEVEWLGAGSAIVIGAVLAAWRFAGLRVDISEKWGYRIEVAKAGLSEHATEVLRNMEGEIADLLGTGEPFDPLDVVKDPAALRAQAKEFLKLIRLRDGAGSRFRWLLQVGPVGLFAAIVFALGATIVFLDLSDLLVISWLFWVGVWLSIVSGLVLIADFVTYAYLQNYLSKADVESRS